MHVPDVKALGFLEEVGWGVPGWWGVCHGGWAPYLGDSGLWYLSWGLWAGVSGWVYPEVVKASLGGGGDEVALILWTCYPGHEQVCMWSLYQPWDMGHMHPSNTLIWFGIYAPLTSLDEFPVSYINYNANNISV